MSDSDSEKLERLRRAAEEASPEWAAAVVARRFEKEAIQLTIPLIADTGTSVVHRRLLEIAASMWRELVKAEPRGLTLFELECKLFRTPGEDAAAAAINLLRTSGTVRESRDERRLVESERITLRSLR